MEAIEQLPIGSVTAEYGRIPLGTPDKSKAYTEPYSQNPFLGSFLVKLTVCPSVNRRRQSRLCSDIPDAFVRTGRSRLY